MKEYVVYVLYACLWQALDVERYSYAALASSRVAVPLTSESRLWR